MDWLVDHLAVVMFFGLIFIMFLGYPVAFLLGAIGIGFGFLGVLTDVFNVAQFANLLPRIYGQAVQNQVLVAIPMFIFMGTMLEKSGVAEELLHALQLMLRHVPGGLAIAVTVLGTIMAATTGIVGASVIMLTLIALPVMLARGYDKSLSVGTIASAGTLGILIPPSIMLVIMGDLVGVPVGTLFTGAILPGLLMSGLYIVFIAVACFVWPRLAPRMPASGNVGGDELTHEAAGAQLRAPGAADHAGAGQHLRRLGHAHRGVGRRRAGFDPAGDRQQALQHGARCAT